MPSLLILLLYLFNSYFFKDQSFQTFKEQLKSFSWLTLAMASMAFIIQILFQAGRLYYLAPFPISYKKVFQAFIVGQSVNCFIPLRTGDAVKAQFLSKTQPGESFSKLLGVIILDKLIDIVSLLFLALVLGLPFLRQYLSQQSAPSGFISIAFIALLVLGFLALLGSQIKFVRNRVKDFLKGFKAAESPKKVFLGFLSSTLSWISELFSLIVLCHTFGVHLSLSSAFVPLFILNIGIIAPVSIGNVGLHEISLAFGLSQVGLGRTEALAVAIMHHGFQVLVTVLLGLGALAFLRAVPFSKKK